MKEKLQEGGGKGGTRNKQATQGEGRRLWKEAELGAEDLRGRVRSKKVEEQERWK
jgi:hypothetical protein